VSRRRSSGVASCCSWVAQFSSAQAKATSGPAVTPSSVEQTTSAASRPTTSSHCSTRGERTLEPVRQDSSFAGKRKSHRAHLLVVPAIAGPTRVHALACPGDAGVCGRLPTNGRRRRSPAFSCRARERHITTSRLLMCCTCAPGSRLEVRTFVAKAHQPGAASTATPRAARRCGRWRSTSTRAKGAFRVARISSRAALSSRACLCG
jgi:hypothetical protein